MNKQQAPFWCTFILVVLVIAQLPVSRVSAQTNDSLKKVLNSIISYNNTSEPEKIFVQFDRPNYYKADTLWFKAYVFDASTMGATSKSGIMYIEVADEHNVVVIRDMVNLVLGTGWGNIPLTEKNFPEGNYTLRAYTNWMRNFDEHYVFSRQFTINDVQDADWLINAQFNLMQNNGVNTVGAYLNFVRADKRPLPAEQLRAKITAGRYSMVRSDLITDINGAVAFSFNLPDKADLHDINIKLSKKGKGSDDISYSIPVIINRDEKTDLQFMPEGGNLVAGMTNRVGFKAIDEEGSGVNVSGAVYNDAQEKVAEFKTTHLGMGAFDLTPKSGQNYTAKIKLNGKELTYKLPSINDKGVLLHISGSPGSDSLTVSINPTTDVAQQGGDYYLIAQARNVVCYGAAFNIKQGGKQFTIAKSLFPTGIARFTLLNTAKVPVAEWIVFIDQHDALRVQIIPSKQSYGKRDSVGLTVTVIDKSGNPVAASLAMSVTDDAQVKPDTTGGDNILYRLLLTDDLKGYVENPAWYFASGKAEDRAGALDNLMLTQGWVSYDWKAVFQPVKAPLWPAETQFKVTGKVTNMFNKPVAQTRVELLSARPVVFTDTLTNANGEFVLSNLHPADTAAYSVQARNKRGRTTNVWIDVDEFKPPQFGSPLQRQVPWYVNIDTGRLNAIHTRQAYNIEQENSVGMHQLKEVEVKAEKIIKDSKSLVPGGADFTLDEHDLQAMGKTTLGDVLREKVSGFTDHYRRIINHDISQGPRVSYAIFIFDGVSSLNYIPPGETYFSFIRDLLKDISAKDVKGVEVMSGRQGQMRYTTQFLSVGTSPFDFSFIEITTYSGSGLFLKKTPGLYVYRPIIFASQKQFYSPKYTVNKPDGFTNTRSTIYWNPNVITDNTGCATVNFYTGDKNGSYTITIQGTDLQGNLGYAQSKIQVKAGN